MIVRAFIIKELLLSINLLRTILIPFLSLQNAYPHSPIFLYIVFYLFTLSKQIDFTKFI